MIISIHVQCGSRKIPITFYRTHAHAESVLTWHRKEQHGRLAFKGRKKRHLISQTKTTTTKKTEKRRKNLIPNSLPPSLPTSTLHNHQPPHMESNALSYQIIGGVSLSNSLIPFHVSPSPLHTTHFICFCIYNIWFIINSKKKCESEGRIRVVMTHDRHPPLVYLVLLCHFA